MKHYLKSVLLLLLLATTTVACMQEIDTEGVSGNNDPEVTFTFELPAQAKPSTRVSDNENAINHIYVLAFDKENKFSYYRSVSALAIKSADDDETNPQKKFKVSLIKSTGTDDKYSFVLIANMEGNSGITGLKDTDKIDDLVDKITCSSATILSSPFPMSSLPTLPKEIKNGTEFSGNENIIPLTRMVARIDVSVSAALSGKYRITPNTETETENVVFYNYNTKGWVYAPKAAFTKTVDGNDVVQSHVQKTTIGTDPTTTKGPIVGDDGNTFYIFEAKNEGSTPPCIVVKLDKHNGSGWESAGYYKVIFEQTVDGTTTKYDVLRNHHYKFSINNVYNKGFDSQEKAYNSVVTGIEANITDWAITDVPVVGSDGTGTILAVNKMEFKFSKEKAEDPTDDASLLKIYTNNTLGWRIEDLKVYEDEEGTIESTNKWFALSDDKGLMNSSVEEHTDVKLKRLLENTTAVRKATFKVVAGNIKINIIVKQTTQAGEGGNDPYTFTATNSSKYAINSIEKSFTFTSTGNWEIENVTTPDDKTSLKVNSIPLKGATGSGSSTPVTVTLTTDTDAGEGSVSITFVCTNGYFSNWENNKKVTITFRIAANITYSAHNGWAGSNIYWDGERLTFADTADTTDKQFFQGVFFKWGSLVGLQCNQDWTTSSTCYAPTEWSKEESILINGKTFNKIPYVTTSPSNITTNRQYLLEVHSPSDGKGDICKYITDKGWAPGYSSGVRWRMPTEAEYTLIENYTRSSQFTYPTSFSPDGQTSISSAYYTKEGDTTSKMTSAVLCASGCLWHDGTFSPGIGSYWSSTPTKGNNTVAFELVHDYMDINHDYCPADNNFLRSAGCVVRCVRE